jgi:hypothetical protein
MTRRTLNNRAIGKHIGHACEGHLRGLLHHLASGFDCTVARTLPFEFPVESDGILLDRKGRVRAIFIVAYWDNARNSDSKFYRTRTEYAEAWQAREKYSHHFGSTLQVFTVLYGTLDGWKEQILEDLNEQCPPLLFLPKLIAKAPLQRVIAGAFGEYLARWETGHSDAREVVEQSVVGRSLSAPEREIASTISTLLRTPQRGPVRRRTLRSGATVRVPGELVQTRYRQALSMLSVFGPGEVEDWHLHQNVRVARCEAFARRAFFLGLGTFSVSRSIAKYAVVSFKLRQPFGADGRYEAHRPDFSSWMQLDRDAVAWVLRSHRARTSKPTSVFRGGALDQAVGNVTEIAREVSAMGSKIAHRAAAGDAGAVAGLLEGASLVGATTGHPAGEDARFLPVWNAIVCAIAMAENNRAIRGDLDSRRTEPPTPAEAGVVARCLVKSAAAKDLFSELVRFCAAFQAASLEGLAGLQLPRLLQLDEPCSVLADFYNTLTTNPSHNPLSEVASEWMTLRFPTAQWRGWPNKRGEGLSVSADSKDRRQWTFVSRIGSRILCAECKSVTANNWGNKSKEIFDRVAEMRTAVSSAGLESLSVLVFDGDLSPENIQELKSGIAHDEIWTVDEVIADMRNRGWNAR